MRSLTMDKTLAVLIILVLSSEAQPLYVKRPVGYVVTKSEAIYTQNSGLSDSFNNGAAMIANQHIPVEALVSQELLKSLNKSPLPLWLLNRRELEEQIKLGHLEPRSFCFWHWFKSGLLIPRGFCLVHWF